MSRCSHNQPIRYLNKLVFPLTVSVHTLDCLYLPAGVSVDEHCATGPRFTQGGWWILSEFAPGSCTFAAKGTSPCRRWSMMLLKVSQHSTHSRLSRRSVSEEYLIWHCWCDPSSPSREVEEPWLKISVVWTLAGIGSIQSARGDLWAWQEPWINRQP